MVRLLIGGSPTAADEENRIPNGARTILERAEQFELLSSDPRRRDEVPEDGFHGWRVLGKTVERHAETRKKLGAAFRQGVEAANEKAAKQSATADQGHSKSRDLEQDDLVNRDQADCVQPRLQSRAQSRGRRHFGV